MINCFKVIKYSVLSYVFLLQVDKFRSRSIVWNIITATLNPKNHPFAVLGISIIVDPMFKFSRYYLS
jgi:hypothetical protein